MSDNKGILNNSEIYGYNDTDMPHSAHQIRYHYITKSEKTDAKLKQELVSHKDYNLETFRGGDQNHCLICRNSKICLPTELQKKIVDWYHEMICHPGENHTENTLRQCFDWKGLSTTVHDVCKKCPTCQSAKKLIRNMANCHLNRLKNPCP